MTTNIQRFCVACLLIYSSSTLATPAFIDALATVPFVASTPSSDPDDWLLAHVDVETTGLVPGYHEIIDIGVIMTNLQGEEVDRLFMRIMPDHPERVQPGAVAVNGFSVERWQKLGFSTTEQALIRLIQFHHRVADSRHVLFVGYNAWFDIAFLDHLFRQQDKTWRELYHYFILDLPSMAWSLGMRDLASRDIALKLGIRPETTDPLEHTGITGAAINADIYRGLRQLRNQSHDQSYQMPQQ